MVDTDRVDRVAHGPIVQSHIASIRPIELALPDMLDGFARSATLAENVRLSDAGRRTVRVSLISNACVLKMSIAVIPYAYIVKPVVVDE
jgi:hypothetical protein